MDPRSQRRWTIVLAVVVGLAMVLSLVVPLLV